MAASIRDWMMALSNGGGSFRYLLGKMEQRLRMQGRTEKSVDVALVVVAVVMAVAVAVARFGDWYWVYNSAAALPTVKAAPAVILASHVDIIFSRDQKENPWARALSKVHSVSSDGPLRQTRENNIFPPLQGKICLHPGSLPSIFIPARPRWWQRSVWIFVKIISFVVTRGWELPGMGFLDVLQNMINRTHPEGLVMRIVVGMVGR